MHKNLETLIQMIKDEEEDVGLMIGSYNTENWKTSKNPWFIYRNQPLPMELRDRKFLQTFPISMDIEDMGEEITDDYVDPFDDDLIHQISRGSYKLSLYLDENGKPCFQQTIGVKNHKSSILCAVTKARSKALTNELGDLLMKIIRIIYGEHIKECRFVLGEDNDDILEDLTTAQRGKVRKLMMQALQLARDNWQFVSCGELNIFVNSLDGESVISIRIDEETDPLNGVFDVIYKQDINEAECEEPDEQMVNRLRELEPVYKELMKKNRLENRALSDLLYRQFTETLRDWIFESDTDELVYEDNASLYAPEDAELPQWSEEDQKFLKEYCHLCGVPDYPEAITVDLYNLLTDVAKKLRLGIWITASHMPVRDEMVSIVTVHRSIQ